MGALNLLHRLTFFPPFRFTINLNKYTSWSGSALQGTPHFCFQGRSLSFAQQDLVPRHQLGKFSLHTRRHDEMMLNEEWRCLMNWLQVIHE